MLENVKIEDVKKMNELPSTTRLSFNLAIDLGSTGTRGIAYPSDFTELPEEDTEKPDYYIGSYEQDYSGLRLLKPNLYDSLEFHIAKDGKGEFSCLKGTLAVQMQGNKMVSSSISKMEQDATKINIHSFITMELLKYIVESGYTIPETQVIDIKLTFAMPPEDTEDGRINQIKESLAGTYQVVMPRLGTQLSYKIEARNIEILSECNAVAEYYVMFEDEGESILEEQENVLIFEGGGRSSSVAIIKGGQLLLKANSNINDINGNDLKEELNKSISEALKRTRLSDEAVSKALCCGYFKQGIEKIDVADIVESTKENYADKCIAPLMKALDKAKLSSMDLQRIVFSGRLFSETADEKESIYIHSLADYVIKRFMEVNSIKIKGSRVSKKFPIPAGLVAYRLGLE